MFLKRLSNVKYDFYIILKVLNRTCIGISCYSVKKSEAVVTIAPSKYTFYTVFMLRLLVFLVALIYLPDVKYKFNNLEEFVINVMSFLSMFCGFSVPIVTYVFQKPYYKIVSSLIDLDNLINSNNLLKKKPSYKLLIWNIRSSVVIAIISTITQLVLHIQFVHYFERFPIYSYTLYYIYYHFFISIIMSFNVLLHYIQLCFKCINDALNEIASRRNRLDGDTLTNLNKLHEEVVDNFRMVLRVFSWPIILILSISTVSMTLATYNVIAFTLMMNTAVIAMMLIYLLYVLHFFGIFYFCDSAIKEVRI